MKTGKTLVELATELQRQAETKRDFLAPTSALALVADDNFGPGEMQMKLGDIPNFGVRDTAHRQLGEHVGIPAPYYDRMRQHAPALLAENVNHWLHTEPSTRMLRTLDGNVRGFLSDRFRALDNFDLAEIAIPVFQDLDVEFLSMELTERRMYIKVADKRLMRDVPSGRKMGDGSHVFFDTVSPAAILSNSEIGFGAWSLEVGIWTKLCTNMAIASSRSMKKYHVGGKHALGDEQLYALLTDETKKKTDQAVLAQTRDVLKAAFEEARFDALINDVKGMAEQKIEADPLKVIEVTAKKFNMNESERGSVLRHLIEGGDMTRYGLFNAITRTAEDLPDYDRATDFERLGGKIIELPRTEWEQLAVAA